MSVMLQVKVWQYLQILFVSLIHQHFKLPHQQFKCMRPAGLKLASIARTLANFFKTLDTGMHEHSPCMVCRLAGLEGPLQCTVLVVARWTWGDISRLA